MRDLYVYKPSPEGAIALVGGARYGILAATGQGIVTSRVVRVEGNVITTFSGSQYRCIPIDSYEDYLAKEKR